MIKRKYNIDIDLIQFRLVILDEKDNMAFPKGSIKKLIGRELTWDDESVELKEE